VNLSSPLFNLV